MLIPLPSVFFFFTMGLCKPLKLPSHSLFQSVFITFWHCINFFFVLVYVTLIVHQNYVWFPMINTKGKKKSLWKVFGWFVLFSLKFANVNSYLLISWQLHFSWTRSATFSFQLSTCLPHVFLTYQNRHLIHSFSSISLHSLSFISK